jgi:hypothetical protein
MEILDLDGMGKEHEDWIRHAAFDQVRKLHRGKEKTIAELVADATTLTAFFLAPVEDKAPKKTAQVIPLTVVSKDTLPPVDDNAALKRFYQRYNEDNALAMTDSEWNEWVNKLPKDEFHAMISVHDAREGGEA